MTFKRISNELCYVTVIMSEGDFLYLKSVFYDVKNHLKYKNLYVVSSVGCF